jgi:hypothetical protein
MLVAVNRLHAQVARRLAVFDRAGLSVDDGCRSSAAWLRAFGRMTGPGAAAWVRRARLTTQLPVLAQAAVSGAVSVEHVDRVVRLVQRVGPQPVTAVEPVLVRAATELDPAGLGRVCDRVRAHVDPDGVDVDAGRDFARRGLSLAAVDGMVVLHGQLDPEGGAALRAALDACMPAPQPGEERTPAQRRADALVELARGALRDGNLPRVGGARPQVAVLLTPDVLQPAAAAGSVGAPAWLEWIGDIPARTAERIACDADVWRAVLDPATGQPLDVGRAHRLVPHWIRKALLVRDRGCRFPGCHAPPAWTDAHHLRAWAQGGATDLTNLIMLCRFHHGLVHEGGWRIHYDTRRDTVAATRPDGRPYEIRGRPSTSDKAA